MYKIKKNRGAKHRVSVSIQDALSQRFLACKHNI